MKVINLFGGPGAGKSTTAAGLFWLLKNRGLRVELVTEYAKALAWAKRGEELSDQFYVYAKQHHRQHVLKGQVDFMVTDSPLLLTLLYTTKEQPASYRQFVIDTWNSYDNVSYFINRVKPYVQIGRFQNELEADLLGNQTYQMLRELGINPVCVDGHSLSANFIVDNLEQRGLLKCGSY